MKKISQSIFMLAVTMLTTTALMAQTTDGEAFGPGTKVLNVHLGIGSTLYASGFRGTMPPVSISYEQAIADGKWGVGGYLGRTGAKWGYEGDTWKYSYTTIGARGAYHFYTTDQIDAYGGLMLGYNIVSSKWKGTAGDGNLERYNASSSGLGYAIFVGGRYYFTEKIGASAELGYGIAILNVGLSVKL